MGRRADQTDAGRGLAHLGDPGIDLLAGQMATFAGLGALSHLDLDLEGTRQIAARHAKAGACHLFDGRVLGVAVGKRRLAARVLAALAGVGASVQAVHGDGHALVRLLADGAIGHGAGVEAPDDIERGLDLVERHGGATRGVEVEQVAQAHGAALAVQARAVLLEGVVVVLAARGLQQIDGLRIDQMVLAAERAPLGKAEGRQLRRSRRLENGERGIVAFILLELDIGNTHAAHAAHGAGEVLVHEVLGKAHGLEDLSRVVALHRGDTHLGHDGDDTVGCGLVVVGDTLLGRDIEIAAGRQIGNHSVCVIGIDAAGRVAHKRREVVRGHGVAAFHHNIGKGAHAGANQMVVHAAHGEQRRHGHLALPGTIREHHDVHAVAHGVLDLCRKLGERPCERALAGIAAIHRAKAVGLEAGAVDGADAVELVLVEQRALQAHQLAGLARILEQVAMVAQIQHSRGHHMLAQGVDRRVGDLGEQLVEVVEERAGLLGQARQGRVDAHRGERGLASLGHGSHDLVDIVPVVAELGHAHGGRNLGVLGGRRLVGTIEVVDRERLLGDPVAIGLLLGVAGTKLVVVDHTAAGEIDLEHLAGPQASRGQDVLGFDLDRADLRGKHEAAVARHVVAGRTQAVAVERGAERAAIGKGDRRRTVPGLHEHGLVGIVGAAVLGEAVVMVPWLGQQHRGGAREGTAVHDKELEHVVENRGVGALAVDDGHHTLKVVLQHGAVQVGLAGANPVDVALEGVDLAVVDDVAVGVSTLPAGRGVGRVTGVYERHGRLDGGVVEVDEEAAHLRGHEHALVHDGARAHGAHVEDLVVERKLGVGLLLDGAAAHVQATLEGIACRRVVRAAQKCLQNGRHTGAGRLTQVMRVDRHLAPKEQRHTGLGAAFLKDAASVLYALVVLRKEQHGDAVVALLRQNLPALLRLLAKEVVRNLEQDAGAVAGVALKAGAASMLEVHQDGKRVIQNLMVTLAVNIGQGADTARVVVELRAVKALLSVHG